MNDKQAKEILKNLEDCPPFSLIKLPSTDPRSKNEFRISVTLARHLNHTKLETLFQALNTVGELLLQDEDEEEAT